jgi:hypothetical protein
MIVEGFRKRKGEKKKNFKRRRGAKQEVEIAAEL